MYTQTEPRSSSAQCTNRSAERSQSINCRCKNDGHQEEEQKRRNLSVDMNGSLSHRFTEFPNLFWTQKWSVDLACMTEKSLAIRQGLHIAAWFLTENSCLIQCAGLTVQGGGGGWRLSTEVLFASDPHNFGWSDDTRKSRPSERFSAVKRNGKVALFSFLSFFLSFIYFQFFFGNMVVLRYGQTIRFATDVLATGQFSALICRQNFAGNASIIWSVLTVGLVHGDWSCWLFACFVSTMQPLIIINLLYLIFLKERKRSDSFKRLVFVCFFMMMLQSLETMMQMHQGKVVLNFTPRDLLSQWKI